MNTKQEREERVVPNSRVNSIVQIETALKVLRAQGYDTTALWADHNNWLLSIDSTEPTEDDRRWATRSVAPSSSMNHFVNGQPEILTASRAFVDRQYRLTTGQRAVLRDRYGFTPAVHVILTNVSMFGTSNIIASVTLKSGEHVDNRRRTRVLNEIVLSPASAFFSSAASADAAKAAVNVVAGNTLKTPNKFRLLSEYADLLK